jgi:hypothetical protein
MGCGQVVRHQVLVLAFGGSNPSIPANIRRSRMGGPFYFADGWVGIRTGVLAGVLPEPCFGSMPVTSNKVVTSKSIFLLRKQGESLHPSHMLLSV